MRMRLVRATVALVGIPAALAGCAMLAGPAMQPVEVRVEAQDPAWAGPLDCEASNAAGTWKFVAPGTVTVRVSSPLWITCKPPPGARADRSVTPARPTEAAREASRKGARACALAGGAGGAALAIALAPVGGAGIGVALAAGSAFRGAEIGGATGALGAPGPSQAYPSPVVIRVVEPAPAEPIAPRG